MSYKRERCAAPSCLGAVEPINHLGVCRRCRDPQWVDVVEFEEKRGDDYWRWHE